MILLSLLLLGSAFSAETNETVSVMEGDSVSLLTNLTEIKNDDTIVWVFGPKGLVISQITRKRGLTSIFITDDVGFKGRLQVDQNTGSLTIRNTRNRHSGAYRLTISGEKTTTRIFNVVVFDVVGETDGVKSVSAMEGESVTLQNDAADAQKDDLIVWRFGDKGILLAQFDVETDKSSLNDADKRFRNILQLDETGSLTITKARPEHSGHYEVQIRGRESSQQFILSVSENSGQSSAVIAGIVVAVLLLAGLLAGVVIYYRRKISKLQNQQVEEEKVSELEGRTVALKTDTELQNSDEIKWWFSDGTNPITEKSDWTVQNDDIEDPTVTDERFRNKLQLGGRTGDLIISYIRTIHSGVYKVQISGENRRTKYKRFILTVEVNKVPAEVGKSLTLRTGIKTESGDILLWTFGVKNRLVVKGESGNTSFAENFRDRVELDHETGSLTIKNITNEDFGHFQLQVINNDRNRFRRFNVIEGQQDNAKGSKEKKPLLPQFSVA